MSNSNEHDAVTVQSPDGFVGRDETAVPTLVVDPGIKPSDSDRDLLATFKNTQGERYSDREELGVGGYGSVRLVHDHRLGRAVARKSLRGKHAQDDSQRRRFLREARIQGQLEHPMIVPVYDLGTTNNELYFTMRRVRGLTLRDVIKQSRENNPVVARFTRRRLLTAFVSVCNAIHFAHTRGVIHRDLKPSNIMFGDFGEVYVLDWGLAKLIKAPDPTASPMDPGIEADQTQHGIALGTAGYMSPEQVRGVRDLDPRSDVYALGAILYEILALRPLLERTTVLEMAKATVAGVDARPSKHNATVAPELDKICLHATALDPARRYENAGELAEAVERYLDGDRDLERRQTLSEEKSQLARKDYLRSRDASVSVDEQDQARTRAMSEVASALAFDPTNKEARQTLMQILVEAPERLPREAQNELREVVTDERQKATKFASIAILALLVSFPLAVFLGFRNWVVLTVGNLLVLATAMFSRWMSVTKNLRGPFPLMLAAMSYTAIALGSIWLGPFMVVPGAATAIAMLFGMLAERKERGVFIALGALTIIGPLVLQIAGVFPVRMVFRATEIAIQSDLFEERSTPTLLALTYSSLGFLVLPLVIIGRMRDTVVELRRTLVVQSWHLRKLVDQSQ